MRFHAGIALVFAGYGFCFAVQERDSSCTKDPCLREAGASSAAGCSTFLRTSPAKITVTVTSTQTDLKTSHQTPVSIAYARTTTTVTTIKTITATSTNTGFTTSSKPPHAARSVDTNSGLSRRIPKACSNVGQYSSACSCIGVTPTPKQTKTVTITQDKTVKRTITSTASTSTIILTHYKTSFVYTATTTSTTTAYTCPGAQPTFLLQVSGPADQPSLHKYMITVENIYTSPSFVPLFTSNKDRATYFTRDDKCSWIMATAQNGTALYASILDGSGSFLQFNTADEEYAFDEKTVVCSVSDPIQVAAVDNYYLDNPTILSTRPNGYFPNRESIVLAETAKGGQLLYLSPRFIPSGTA